MNYQEFLEGKKHSAGMFGINPVWFPEKMFDFQKYASEHVIRKGRCAGFLDTGLGKTIIELTVANNHVLATNKPVLIITPLAVAFQFLKEAEKFGIGDIEYSKDGKYTSKIVICNYERLNKFNYSDFDCVICDESSILKNFDGAIKSHVTTFLKKVKYRYLFTATPSPNDFIELGTSSEALGYMGYMDMLTKFFTNNEDTVSPMKIGVKWTLKGHARDDFFKWVSGWSISMRKPSDLGFSDDLYRLPKLNINYRPITTERSYVNDDGQLLMFNKIAKRQSEVQSEGRATINERCALAAELASNHETSVFWCNLNKEGDILQSMVSNAYQLSGSMNLEKKEEILLAFSSGEIKKLITKPKITCFGLNWQHCNHTVYFPSFSYERWYQAIRRFWRFGQEREVYADIPYSDGQQRLIDSVIAKANKADELFTKLNSSLNQNFNDSKKEFNKELLMPNFL